MTISWNMFTFFTFLDPPKPVGELLQDSNMVELWILLTGEPKRNRSGWKIPKKRMMENSRLRFGNFPNLVLVGGWVGGFAI